MKSHSKSKSPARRLVRVNLRAVVVLGVSLVAAAALFAGVYTYRKSSQGQAATLRQARELAHAKPPRYDLAGSYLKEYLSLRPDDPDALELQAEIINDTASTPEHVRSALAVGDKVLRLDPERSETRRRQVKLYLKLAQLEGPDRVPFQNARLVADAMLKDVEEAAAKAKTEANDPEANRLMAQIIEGQAKMASWDKAILDDAVKYYRAALKSDPKDVIAARALAEIYINQKNDMSSAEQVLNALLEASPTAETHLARYAVFLAADREDKGRKAAVEMDQAVALKPQDRDIRLEASSDALRRGDIDSARRHLDAIPQKEQDNYKVRLARGVVELHENRADEAIDNWRQSLVMRGGTDEDLTWRLAFVLLNLGRTTEAAPLLDQYRRLTGGNEPTPACSYLFALRDLKENHPVSAIKALETLKLKAPPILEPQIYYTLGQAYEAIRDESQALDAYEKASVHPLAKKSASPRLAQLRLLQTLRPDEAEVSLRKGLSSSPDEPTLLVALARVEYQKQMRRPFYRRSWKDFEDTLARARQAAPNSGALAMVEADYQAQNGRLDEAVSMLGQAIKHDKKDAELWTAYANRLAMRGEADEALMVLERASDPAAVGDQAAIRIARAQLLTIQGHGQEAREALVKDLDKLPPVQRPLVWAALGDFYVGQKDFASARQAYTEWANLLPEDPKPRLFLLERALADATPDSDRLVNECIESLEKIGKAQELYTRIAQAEVLLRKPRGASAEPESARDKRFEKAETLIKQIQQQAPKQRYGFLLEGQLQEARGKIKEAIKAYERALELDAGQTALSKLIVLYSRTHDDAKLQRLNENRPDLSAVQDRIAAEVAMGMKENDRAKTIAAKVVLSDPENLDARVWQARLLTQMGDLTAAEAALRELTTHKPAQPGPWLALLAWQLQKGQPKSAAATVDQIKSKVKTAQPEFLWAQCYRKIGDLAHALEYYEASLVKWPDDSAVASSAADFFQATGRAEQAEAALRAYLKRNPKQPWAPRALALLLSARGRQNPEAWEEANRLMAAAPNSPDNAEKIEDRLTRAIVLARSPDSSNRRAAAEQLERLLRDLPRDVATAALSRRVLSELYVESGELSKVRRQAEIDAQGATSPAVIAAYAQSLMREELWDQAEKQVDRVESLDPGQPYVARLRAQLLKGRGKLGDAIALLEKYFQDHENQPAAPAIGAEILRGLMELGPGADDSVDRLATALSKKWPRTGWMLASFRAKQGQYKDAFDLYASAAAAGSREAVENSIALAVRDRDPEHIKQAAIVIDAALKLHPEDADLLTKKGFLRHFQRDYEDEVRLYEQALALEPIDFRFLNNMAWTLSEGLGQYPEALKRIEEAFSKAGAYPQFLDTRGVIYTRLNRLDEAVKDFLVAAQNAKGTASYPTIQFHLARAYYLAHRESDARLALERAKTADPKINVESLEPKERGEFEDLSAKLVVAAKP
jgi:tetratricopeptide (TPR) repeat protein